MLWKPIQLENFHIIRLSVTLKTKKIFSTDSKFVITSHLARTIQLHLININIKQIHPCVANFTGHQDNSSKPAIGPSVRPFICPSVHSSACLFVHPAKSPFCQTGSLQLFFFVFNRKLTLSMTFRCVKIEQKQANILGKKFLNQSLLQTSKILRKEIINSSRYPNKYLNLIYEESNVTQMHKICSINISSFLTGMIFFRFRLTILNKCYTFAKTLLGIIGR